MDTTLYLEHCHRTVHSGLSQLFFVFTFLAPPSVRAGTPCRNTERCRSYSLELELACTILRLDEGSGVQLVLSTSTASVLLIMIRVRVRLVAIQAASAAVRYSVLHVVQLY